ncbi:mechanosensitive ion channel [Clostridium malenominatum]|uniref:Mechanosensitive ion channel n=1 Tax=Clostridium malenominatum TaxID=1539 RepID=A0ABN1J3Q0_9CLOT
MGGLALEVSSYFKGVGTFGKLILTIAVFVLLGIFNKAFSNYIDKANWSSVKTIKLKKAFSVFTKILALIFSIPIWLHESQNILTFLGLFSAGIAFALRDLLANFLGWLMISSHKPFVVGDRIRIEDSLGDVLEMNWFHTTIIEVTQNQDKTYGQSTGRLTYIPNAKFILQEVINESSTFPYTWNEIQIHLNLNSNWKKAKEIIMEVASKELGNMEEEVKECLEVASKTHPIYYQNLSHIVYTSLGEEKITLTLRFICRSRNYRNLEHGIIEGILEEFEKYEDIELK